MLSWFPGIDFTPGSGYARKCTPPMDLRVPAIVQIHLQGERDVCVPYALLNALIYCSRTCPRENIHLYTTAKQELIRQAHQFPNTTIDTQYQMLKSIMEGHIPCIGRPKVYNYQRKGKSTARITWKEIYE